MTGAQVLVSIQATAHTTKGDTGIPSTGMTNMLAFKGSDHEQYALNICEDSTADNTKEHKVAAIMTNVPLSYDQPFQKTYRYPVGSSMNSERKCILWWDTRKTIGSIWLPAHVRLSPVIPASVSSSASDEYDSTTATVALPASDGTTGTAVVAASDPETINKALCVQNLMTE
ncbi:hypothetical protein MRX96_021496 [Rhipicephalus microplus]